MAERKRDTNHEAANSTKKHARQALESNQVLNFIHGLPQELESIQYHVEEGFIPHQEAAPRFRELLAQNPEWAYLFDHFRQSPKHLVQLLVELYPEKFYAYSHIYRITTAINLGDSNMRRYMPMAPRPIEDEDFPITGNKRTTAANIMADGEVLLRLHQFSQNPAAALDALQQAIANESNQFIRDGYTKALSEFDRMYNLRIPDFKDEYQPRPYQAYAILHGMPEDKAVGNTIDLSHEICWETKIIIEGFRIQETTGSVD